MPRGRKPKGYFVNHPDHPEAPLDLTQTDAFKKAVAEAAAEASKEAVRQFVAELQMASAPHQSGDTGDMMKQLAMHIAELTDNNAGRPRIAPEVLAKRERAKAKMLDLIKAARAEGRTPEYRLRSKTVLADQLIEPFWLNPSTKIPQPTEIDWFGLPNEAMMPINAAAEEIYQAYREWMGEPELITQLAERPTWMTSGGLVIKGTPMTKRIVGGIDGTTTDYTPPSPPSSFDGLKVRGEIDPTAARVRILGSIAEPARQNYAGAR